MILYTGKPVEYRLNTDFWLIDACRLLINFLIDDFLDWNKKTPYRCKCLVHNLIRGFNYDVICWHTCQFLSDIQPSEKSWDTHRAEAESVRLLYSLSTEFTKYASRIYDCSQILKFAPTPDKLVLKHAFFCRVRYCPVCQWRRSLLWRAVMFQQLPAIKEVP